MEPRTFAVDGVTYEIDLNQDHADQPRDTLTRWTRAGQRTPRATSSAGGVGGLLVVRGRRGIGVT